MPTTDPSDLLGRLSAVYLRTDDLDTSTRFFTELFDAGFAASGTAEQAEQRMVSGCSAAPDRIDLVLTADREAAEARLCFTCDDVERARAAIRQRTGSSDEALADDQGLPLGLASPETTPPAAGNGSGALGVVIAQFPDTGQARAFYEAVFGLRFERIGSSGDFWWVQAGPSLGVFPITHDLTNTDVPRAKEGTEISAFFCVDDLEQARARVSELGGSCEARVAFGPYAACICSDVVGVRFGLWCTPK